MTELKTDDNAKFRALIHREVHGIRDPLYLHVLTGYISRVGLRAVALYTVLSKLSTIFGHALNLVQKPRLTACMIFFLSFFFLVSRARIHTTDAGR
jgi:hypothetical protein